MHSFNGCKRSTIVNTACILALELETVRIRDQLGLLRWKFLLYDRRCGAYSNFLVSRKLHSVTKHRTGLTDRTGSNSYWSDHRTTSSMTVLGLGLELGLVVDAA